MHLDNVTISISQISQFKAIPWSIFKEIILVLSWWKTYLLKNASVSYSFSLSFFSSCDFFLTSVNETILIDFSLQGFLKNF